MGLFTVGNAVVSLSDVLRPMLVARVGTRAWCVPRRGLQRGTKLAGRHRVGVAVAVVFGGLRLALALGVARGTSLGSILS